MITNQTLRLQLIVWEASSGLPTPPRRWPATHGVGYSSGMCDGCLMANPADRPSASEAPTVAATFFWYQSPQAAQYAFSSCLSREFLVILAAVPAHLASCGPGVLCCATLQAEWRREASTGELGHRELESVVRTVLEPESRCFTWVLECPLLP